MKLEVFIDENENTIADKLVIQQNLIDTYLVDNVDVPYFTSQYDGLDVTGNNKDHNIKMILSKAKLRSRLSYKLALSIDQIRDVNELLTFCKALVTEMEGNIN